MGAGQGGSDSASSGGAEAQAGRSRLLPAWRGGALAGPDRAWDRLAPTGCLQPRGLVGHIWTHVPNGVGQGGKPRLRRLGVGVSIGRLGSSGGGPIKLAAGLARMAPWSRVARPTVFGRMCRIDKESATGNRRWRMHFGFSRPARQETQKALIQHSLAGDRRAP